MEPVTPVEVPSRDQSIRYMYLTDCGFDPSRGGRYKSRGAIAIAYRYSGDSVEYNVSFCSPKDRYVKAEGRALAEKRLLDSPRVITVTGVKSSRLLREFVRHAVILLPEAPRWVQDNLRVMFWQVGESFPV